NIHIFTLSLHDALPIWVSLTLLVFTVIVGTIGTILFLLVDLHVVYFTGSPLTESPVFGRPVPLGLVLCVDVLFLFVLGTCLLHRSEEHTSELQSRENLV